MIPQLLTATEQAQTKTNWFIQNWQSNMFTLFTVLLSGIVSLAISAAYYRKGNRDNLRINVIYPTLTILNDKSHDKQQKDKLLEISKDYAVRYMSRREEAVFLNLIKNFDITLQREITVDYNMRVILVEYIKDKMLKCGVDIFSWRHLCDINVALKGNENITDESCSDLGVIGGNLEAIFGDLFNELFAPDSNHDRCKRAEQIFYENLETILRTGCIADRSGMINNVMNEFRNYGCMLSWF